MINRRELVALGAAAPLLAASGAGLPEPRVERGYARCRFGQLHLRRAGSGRRRPPLLCFHQVPNSGQIYTDFLPLIATDRLAVAFDSPGYGMSDASPDPQTIGAYADAMEDAVASLRLGGAVDLIGYHTGAAIAAELASRRRLPVRRVMLVAVPVFTDAERASFGALPPIPFDEDGDWAREEWRRSWRWRGPGQSRASVLRTYAEKMRPGARERGATAIAAYDMARALAGLRQPLMIVRPRDDLWDATARARTLRPDAAYVELPDVGHGLWEVAAARMATLARGFFDR